MNKWYSIFVSNAGVRYRVEIEDSTLSADRAFTMAAQPVQLRFEQGDNKYTPIRSQSCTINVADSQDMSTIYSQLWDRKLTVTRISDSYKMFDGWVVPSQWQQPFTSGVNQFIIEAQDGFGLLSHRKYRGKEYYEDEELRRCDETFGNFMNRAARIIGCTASWNHSKTYANEIAFSEDMMLPDDYYLGEGDDDWKYWADGISMICSFLGAYAYIENGVLTIKEYDNNYTLWTAATKMNALSSDISVEIVPAVSKVTINPNGKKRCWINDVNNIDRYKFAADSKWGSTDHFTTTDGGGSSDAKYWAGVPVDTKDLDQVTDARACAVCDSDKNKPNIYDDAKMYLYNAFKIAPKACHANCVTGLYLSIKAKIMIDTTKAPNTSHKSIAETSSYPHIKIKIGSTTYSPTTVTTENYGSEETGTMDVRYNFANLPKGRMQIVGWYDRTLGRNLFVESIEVYQDLDIEDYKVESIVSEDYVNDLDIEADMWYKNSTGYSSPASCFSGIVYHSSLFNDMYSNSYITFMQPKVLQQYNKCRRAFTLSLPLSGFSIGKNATFAGKQCTIEAATLDLQYDSVSAVLLESYTND